MSLEINNIYIVLGNKLKENSKISTTLRKRLDKCIEKYKKKDLVIVSGGNIAKQKQTEAYVMKNYLMEKGKIPSKYIIKERQQLWPEKSLQTRDRETLLAEINQVLQR